MVSTERNSEISGPIKALRARSERRKQEANELAGSRPVAVLKEKVLQHHPDAVITVTNTRLHPFARIGVEAAWDITYKNDITPTSAGNIHRQASSGNSVEIAFLRKKHEEGYHGYIVNSGNGEDLISNPVDPSVTNTITAAVDNPLSFKGRLKPLSGGSRRAI